MGPDRTVEVYMSEESEEEVTVLECGVTAEVTVLQPGTQQGDSSRSESCQEF